MDILQSVRSKSTISMFHLNSCEYFDKRFALKIDFQPISSIFRLPWNQHTVRGWIGETVFSVISSSLYLFTNVVFLTFFIGICEFHRAFLEYFNALMIEVDNPNGNECPNSHGCDIKTMLCNIINFHVAIKRFV